MSSNDVQPAPIWPPSRRRLISVFVLGMLWLNLIFFFRTREGIKRGYPDFTIFYTAGTILREGLGRQLYDRNVQYEVQQRFAGNIPFRHGPLPYNHPPFEAPLFVPLTRLPYAQAFAAWDLMNIAALFGVALLLRRSVDALRSIPPWKFVIGCLAFNPVFACLLQGQDSILMLLFCTLSFNALKKKADPLAGCWLALAAFKFQFIVPIILLLVLWRRGRVALGFGAVGLVLAFISVGLVGMASLLRYPAYVLEIAKTPGLGGVPTNLLPNLHGLATGWSGPLSGAAGAALTGLASIVVFGFAARKGWEPAHPAKLELQFSLAIVVSGLVAWQTNPHDLSLLVLPMVFITDHCITDSSITNPGLHSTTQELLKRFDLLLPTLPLLISPLWMVLWLGIAKVNLMAIPLLWWTWKIGKELSRDPGTACCA